MLNLTAVLTLTDAALETSAESVSNAAEAPATDPGILSVILMGVGIVFAGIVVIAVICRLLLLFGSLGAKNKESKTAVKTEEEFKPDGELAAVIGAVVAEESGVDVKNIKIVSVKRV